MSLPPLVCSTPPPPDQVEEETYKEEIAFNYDLSPTHQYETGNYSLYDVPSAGVEVEDTLYISPSGLDISFQQNSGAEQTINQTSDVNLENDEIGKENVGIEMENCNFSEDCNVEDLDLKLDSLNLDLERVVSVEESLNSTFDDFGTFLSNTDFIPKIENTFSDSDKEFKSQGTCSEESTSLHNEDWDNISQNSFNTNLNTTTDKDDNSFINIKKDSNDNISKEMLEVLQPPEDMVSSFNKEESVDSGFKSSINNSNDQINNIRTDQSDSKSDVDSSTSDANTLSFSELNDLDKSRTEKEIVNESSIIIPSNLHDVKEDDMQDDETGLCIDDTNYFQNSTDDGNIDFELPNESAVEESINVFCDFASFSNTAEDTIATLEKVASDDDNDFADFAEFQDADVKGDEVVIKTEDSSAVEIEPTNPDDDFGDFDTYDPTVANTDIPCEAKKNDEYDPLKSYTVNDLVFSSDVDVIEILKKAVSTIYDEENLNEGVVDDPKLVTCLGNSWKHLGEYESKQSYLFPWNDSSSQKTILKSLGIDARNILFGPKWNSNMPRFAANLGTSPLQPIKQNIASSTVEHQNEEKFSHNNTSLESNNYGEAKSAGEWQEIDNFTMDDNQPSCNERDDEHTMSDKPHVEPGTKFEKHQPPSILNIGRKINLPDTHIFTPTDSETPWSHTIHYEDSSGSSVPGIPCPIDKTFPPPANDIHTSNINTTNNDFDDFQSHDNQQFAHKNMCTVSQTKETLQDIPQPFPLNAAEIKHKNVEPKSDSCNEFDDFGDFHSATMVEAVVHQTEILPPASVLQPIKITPSLSASTTLPVVNWPEPGDIDTSLFEQLSDKPNTQPTLPSWVEKHEKPSWIVERKDKPMRLESDDLHIPPFVPPKAFSPAPPAFILKETKIDSVVTDNLPVQSNVEVDDFSDFQSGSFNSVLSPPMYTSSDIYSKPFDTKFPSNSFSQYADFHSNPLQSNSHQINTTSFISTPQQPNYYAMPTTLGGSFLKPDQHTYGPSSFSNTEDYPSKPSAQQQQQILQPLSLENFSQINWPNPGIHLQDLSQFNPVNSIHSYSESKESKITNNHSNDDDGWSDFVSIKPSNQSQTSKYQQSMKYQNSTGYSSNQHNEEDDWSDFVSGTVLPSRSANEVKTISQNIHTQGSSGAATYLRNVPQKSTNNSLTTSSLTTLPPLSYSSSKVNSKNHFQNL